jgi:two-component system osmolarity sensor histidine kinase EnvZ
MILIPRTLRGRTALLIVGILIASQAASGAFLWVYHLEPRLQQAAVSVANQVHALRLGLTLLPAEKRAAYIESLRKDHGIQVAFTDNIAPGELLDQPAFRLFVERLRREFQQPVEVRVQPDEYMLWTGLAINGRHAWVGIPYAPAQRSFVGTLVSWLIIGTGLGLLAAYLIVRRINRPLERLAQAATEIGAGQVPPPLLETGPQEIATVSHAFNQMAHDIRRLNEDRTLLLAGVSHDLRTPLARLRLVAEMLHGADAKLRDGLIQDVEDMDTIIGQFLTFVREGVDEPMQSGNLNELVRTLVERYTQHQQSLQLDLAPLPPLRFKPMAMQRLVTNLIDNAIYHGGGEVLVRTRLENNRATLSVLDRGPGIAESDIPRLLRPFSQTRHRAGSGLGLAIAQRIAQLHNAPFNLLPRTGGGLEARVTLPLLGNL